MAVSKRFPTGGIHASSRMQPPAQPPKIYGAVSQPKVSVGMSFVQIIGS